MAAVLAEAPTVDLDIVAVVKTEASEAEDMEAGRVAGMMVVALSVTVVLQDKEATAVEVVRAVSRAVLRVGKGVVARGWWQRWRWRW